MGVLLPEIRSNTGGGYRAGEKECAGVERFVFAYGTGDAGARLTVIVQDLGDSVRGGYTAGIACLRASGVLGDYGGVVLIVTVKAGLSRDSRVVAMLVTLLVIV